MDQPQERKVSQQQEPNQVKYVVRSLSEGDSELDKAGVFWSNNDGWGGLENATRFTTHERMDSFLPLSVGGDSEWMLVEEALDLMRNVVSGTDIVADEPFVMSSEGGRTDVVIRVRCGDDAQWRFTLSLDHESGDIVDLEPEYSPNGEEGFDLAEEKPPANVSNAFQTMRAKAVSLANGRKLDKTPSTEWPYGATVKLVYIYGNGASGDTGWAKRDAEGNLVSAYSLLPLDASQWDVVEERKVLTVGCNNSWRVYKIAVEITAPERTGVLADTLDAAGLGFFTLDRKGDASISIVFDRGLDCDHDGLICLMQEGLTQEQAACELLANNIEQQRFKFVQEQAKLDCLTIIAAALRGQAVRVHELFVTEAAKEGGKLVKSATEQLAELGVSVYVSEDVPGNWGFTGCDADEFASEEAATAAACTAHGIEVQDRELPVKKPYGSSKVELPTVESLIDRALNAACYEVQQAVGETDGGLAGIMFSGAQGKRFGELYRPYCEAEIEAANERIQEPQQGKVVNHMEIAQADGYSVIPSDDGFAYAKTERFEGKFPEWFDGFATEADAWEAAAIEARKVVEVRPPRRTSRYSKPIPVGLIAGDVLVANATLDLANGEVFDFKTLEGEATADVMLANEVHQSSSGAKAGIVFDNDGRCWVPNRASVQLFEGLTDRRNLPGVYLEVRQPHGEFTTSVVAAKVQLIAKLTEDKVRQWVSNGADDLVEIAKSGFHGFGSLAIDDLVQSACDAGLDKRDEVVAELLRVIKIGMLEHTASV